MIWIHFVSVDRQPVEYASFSDDADEYHHGEQQQESVHVYPRDQLVHGRSLKLGNWFLSRYFKISWKL